MFLWTKVPAIICHNSEPEDQIRSAEPLVFATTIVNPATNQDPTLLSSESIWCWYVFPSLYLQQLVGMWCHVLSTVAAGCGKIQCFVLSASWPGRHMYRVNGCTRASWVVMRWELLNRDPRGGMQKEREGENTNTNTPGPERANPEKAREKKSGGRRRRTKTSGGGEDGERSTNETRDQLGLVDESTEALKGKIKNTKEIQLWNARFVRYSLKENVIGPPKKGI